MSDAVIATLAVCAALLWWEPAIYLLLVPFAILRIFATVLLFVAMVGQYRDYWLPAVVAEDKALAAALFKNAGRYTISAECGSARNRRCLFCLVVRSLFDLLGSVPGLEKLKTHFEDAAKSEGLPVWS